MNHQEAYAYSKEVKIGKDITLYNPTYSERDGSKEGVAWYKTGARLGHASLSTNAIGLGNAEASALIGKKFKLSGQKSKPAYIKFNGWYNGDMSPGIVSGAAYAKVYVSIYDLTSRSEITGITVYENSLESSFIKKFSGRVSNNLLVYLQPGHEYVCKLGVESSSSNYGPQAVRTTAGVYLDSIKIDFVD